MCSSAKPSRDAVKTRKKKFGGPPEAPLRRPHQKARHTRGEYTRRATTLGLSQGDGRGVKPRTGGFAATAGELQVTRRDGGSP